MLRIGRILISVAAAAGIGLTLAASAEAQVLYGSMVGAVEDAVSGVVPKAAVTLTNTGTSQARETSTDDQGRYSFVNLLPGQYGLKVVAHGFRPAVFTGLAIAANVVTRQDVRLEVGSLTESVTVSAA